MTVFSPFPRKCDFGLTFRALPLYNGNVKYSIRAAISFERVSNQSSFISIGHFSLFLFAP